MMRVKSLNVGVGILQELPGLAGIDGKPAAVDQVACEPVESSAPIADDADFAGLGRERA